MNAEEAWCIVRESNDERRDILVVSASSTRAYYRACREWARLEHATPVSRDDLVAMQRIAYREHVAWMMMRDRWLAEGMALDALSDACVEARRQRWDRESFGDLLDGEDVS